MASLPLQDIKILDFTRLLPGPFGTLLLADMGATVVKVEDPNGGDYMRWFPPFIGKYGAMFMSINRNKQSLGINLKQKRGTDVIRRLLPSFDVLIEGFRPGVMQRMGLGYDDLKEEFPRLIYCSVTGYGQDGPWVNRPGHDINYIATAGILGLTGQRDAPPTIPGFQLADIAGGGLYSTIGILAAIIERNRTQKGRFIDISMTDGALSFMIPALGEYLASTQEPQRGAELLNGGLGCYQVYETADGHHMALGALEPKFFKRFVELIDRADLLDEHLMKGEASAHLKGELTTLFKSRTRAQWEELFGNEDICCEPVLTLAEVLEHPQISRRPHTFTIEEPDGKKIPQVRTPLMPENREESCTAPPAIGEHTHTLLREANFSAAELTELENEGIIPPSRLGR